MKAVIFVGGFGSRLCEESAIKPKSMIEIGNKPEISGANLQADEEGECQLVHV